MALEVTVKDNNLEQALRNLKKKSNMNSHPLMDIKKLYINLLRYFLKIMKLIVLKILVFIFGEMRMNILV